MRIWKICWIVATLLAVSLTPLSALAQNSNPINDSPASAVTPGYSWLRISAFANVPLAGADVAVYDDAGNLLFQQDNATNDQGVFPAHIDNLPRNFRVDVTFNGNAQQDPVLGSLGQFTLSADERNFDPTYGIVFVNPVTTLASKVVNQMSQPNLALAEDRVRDFLVLPKYASFGAALRQDSTYKDPYFSETLFAGEAKTDGGLDPFIQELAREVVSGNVKTDSFRFPINPLDKPAVKVVKYFVDKLVGGLFAFGVNSAGWAVTNSLKVEKNATQNDINEVQKQLADVQSSVAELKDQLDDLARKLDTKLDQVQLNQIVVPAGALSAKVDGTEDDLTFFAQGCPPLPESDASSSPNRFTDFCVTQKGTIYKELESLNQSFPELSTYILDGAAGPRSIGIIHLYDRVLAQSRRFFRPADSSEIDDMSVYWMAVYAESANLKLELLHDNGAQDNSGGISQLTTFAGAPNGKLQTTLATQARLTFPAVPVNTVVNTLDHTMWLTLPILTFKAPYGDFVTCGLPPRGSLWTEPATTPIAIEGMEWQSPTAPQAAALLKGWSGSNANAWLTENTRAVAFETPESPGFASYYAPGAIRSIGCGPGTVPNPLAWTRDTVGGNRNVYQTLSMANGALVEKPIDVRFNYFYEILSRELKPGEQYYWYPNQ